MAGEIGRLIGRFRPKAPASEQQVIPKNPNLLSYQDIAQNPQQLADFLGKEWTHQQTEYGWEFLHMPYGEGNGHIRLYLTPISSLVILRLPNGLRGASIVLGKPTSYALVHDPAREPEKRLAIDSPTASINFYPDTLRSTKVTKYPNGLFTEDNFPFGNILKLIQRPAQR